jgi:ubiquinone/menaquinone biosynthesis C-methylase UbiE
MHERRFHGDAARLRSPERLARLEVDRVVALSLEEIAPRTLLDVGVGTGVFAEAFAGAGLIVSGVDANPEMLRHLAPPGAGGVFLEAIAEHLPFADRTFDLVFLGHLLHETDDPVAALSEARRVCAMRVAILEWPFRDEEFGPPLGERMQKAAIEAGLTASGLTAWKRIRLRYGDLYLADAAPPPPAAVRV